MEELTNFEISKLPEDELRKRADALRKDLYVQTEHGPTIAPGRGADVRLLARLNQRLQKIESDRRKLALASALNEADRKHQEHRENLMRLALRTGQRF
jgi:hypothetical protein